MSKSAIYTVNDTNTAVATENQQFVTVPFGTVIRRFGPNLQLNGDGIQANGCGYYTFNVSLTLLPTEVGEISAQLYLNGEPIQGAIATGYAATAGNPVNLTLNPMIRLFSCKGTGTVTCGVNASCTVPNFATEGEKK